MAQLLLVPIARPQMYLDYAETITRGALVVMGLAGTGCDVAARTTSSRLSEQTRAAPRAAADDGAPELRKKAPVTPAIIAASQQLLEEHAEAPMGSEFPVVIEGKPYLARIEEHDNASGASSRPPGKHKGVTVYER